MNFLKFLVLSLFSLCLGEGYWDIQLSPQSIASVPFGPSHITVWEHADEKGRYYAMPLAHFLNKEARTVDNIVTGESELNFKVLMWSLEAREAVYMHLKSHINSSIVEAQVELLPMEKIRIVWRDIVRPMSSHFKLADQWRSNTHLPTVVTFQFICTDLEKCAVLKSAMRNNPGMFNALELEYIINGQRSARRRTTVTGSHLVNGRLYSKLSNMHVQSEQRYLSSDDVKTLTSETVTRVISSVITDSDYVDTGDEVSIANVLQHVLERNQVDTENFQPQMWESVFWDPSFARPDKLTHYLNKVLSKDTSDSRKFLLDESQRSSSAEGNAGGSFMGIVKVEAGGGSSNSRQSKVQREDVLNTLRERHNDVEWDGEQFRVKPMKLFRLNLSTLNTSTNIASASLQVRRYESVQSIKLLLSEQTLTPSTTPQLVEARLNEKLYENLRRLEKLNETLTEVRTHADQAIKSVKYELEEKDSLLSNKISMSDNGWKSRLQTMERVTNAWPDYCIVSSVDCGGRDFRHLRATLSGCKAACDSDCRCKSFIHNGNNCYLKHTACEKAQTTGSARNVLYYVKIARLPLNFATWKYALSNRRPETCTDPCRLFS